MGTTVPESGQLTAGKFTERIMTLRSDKEIEIRKRYFKSGKGEYGEEDEFIGVNMVTLASLAKEFEGMPVPELEKMLESPIHEIRMGALSIMNREARKKIAPARLREFFELYLRRHDRINNWDLVDIACMYMTGKYLVDKPRTILYKLAKSKNFWERRTAIVSTSYLIRQGEVDDTFALAEMLLQDKEDLVHKGAGWMLRTAGQKDLKKLLAFLDKYAAIMPRTLLRYSIEKLDEKKKSYYMALKKKAFK
jgi:3-methyladenine DNA glycosylase AlkD